MCGGGGGGLLALTDRASIIFGIVITSIIFIDFPKKPLLVHFALFASFVAQPNLLFIDHVNIIFARNQSCSRLQVQKSILKV